MLNTRCQYQHARVVDHQGRIGVLQRVEMGYDVLRHPIRNSIDGLDVDERLREAEELRSVRPGRQHEVSRAAWRGS